MKIFELGHKRFLDKKKQYIEWKIIGYYTSLQEAERVKKKYSEELPGFKDFPKDFYIEFIEVINLDSNSENIYVVSYEIEYQDYEESEIIGVTSDSISAEICKNKFIETHPNVPDETISINLTKLNVSYWVDGFFTYTV